MKKILFLSLCAVITSSCIHFYTQNPKRLTKGREDILVIAHRGASGYLPEHTLESVALAHGFDPDYIEPDLVVTRDDHLIVLHDIHLENNTNVEEVFPKRKRSDGRWYAIDFSLNEIKKLSVHERTSEKGKVVFKNRFPLNKSSFKVPTFEEYIELIQGLNTSRGREIGIYPEIKAPAFHKSEGKDTVSLLMKILKKYNYHKENSRLFIQSFDPDFLKEFKRRYPNSSIRLVQLIADNSWKESSHDYDVMRTKEGLSKVSEYAYAIGPWIPFVLKGDLIKDSHSHGLKVHVFTLRDKERLSELIERGVDGIFTDFPDL